MDSKIDVDSDSSIEIIDEKEYKEQIHKMSV